MTTIKPTKDAPQEVSAQAEPESPQDKYTTAEIVANAATLFKEPVDIVAAALQHAGIKETSIDAARIVVKAFAERKV